MKIFNIKEPGAEPEALDPRPEIRLGSEGRGRELVIIPAVGDGDCWHVADGGGVPILVAHPSAVSCPKEERPGRILARINACGWYERNRRYRIKDAQGLEILTRGLFAFGDAGRCGNGEDVLALVEASAEFRLSSKYDKHWYRWDGAAWLVESPAERAARLALEALGREEIRWL